MATIHIRSSPLSRNFPPSATQNQHLPWRCTFPFNSSQPILNVTSNKRKGAKVKAMAGDVLGNFGARDPFPAEIESDFAEKVLGDAGTEHKILIPTPSVLSLAQQTCEPVSPKTPPMSKEDAQKLMKKVLGWRLIDSETGLRLQCLWRLKDFGSGVELINRIYRVADAAGYFPNLHLEKPNEVRAELWSSLIGGLSMNDFIVAAKIDEIKTSDLVPKKRIWA